jgi:hypothetical protein
MAGAIPDRQGQLACYHWHEAAYAAGWPNAWFAAHFGFGEPFGDIYGVESRTAPVTEEIDFCHFEHRAC